MLLIRSFSSAWSRAGGFEQHALQNKERHAKTPKTIAANTTRSCRGWVSKKCLNHLPLCLHDCNCHTYLLVCLFIYYVFYTFGISFMNKLWIVNIICMSLCLFVLQILNIHIYIIYNIIHIYIYIYTHDLYIIYNIIHIYIYTWFIYNI